MEPGPDAAVAGGLGEGVAGAELEICQWAPCCRSTGQPMPSHKDYRLDKEPAQDTGHASAPFGEGATRVVGVDCLVEAEEELGVGMLQ